MDEIFQNIAIIPLRSGSKGIKDKNITPLGKVPLFYYSLFAAVTSESIDKVICATDSEVYDQIILKYFSWSSKIILFKRSEKSSTDSASTEIVIQEVIEKYQSEYLTLIQATSPFITASDLDRMYNAVIKEAKYSALTAYEGSHFKWKSNNSGTCEPINYNPKFRPRRQDFSLEQRIFIENGAAYITSRKAYIKNNSRIGSESIIIDMPQWRSIDIDNYEDLDVALMLLSKYERLYKPKLIVSDVDGVLTDSGMYYDSNGELLKKFNTRDGKAFELFRKKGLYTVLATGEKTEIVTKRAQKLMIDEVYPGLAYSKMRCIADLILKLKITHPSEVIFIGDDLNDKEVFLHPFRTFCPKDAIDEISSLASEKLKSKGGEGCIREAYIYLEQIGEI